MDIFDITKEDILKLSDGDLKTLVGLLCEAEFRSSGQSTKGIQWGGNQDAPDGGADVLVDANEKLVSEWIPSNFTVFQVKKPKMPPSSIKKEMRAKGVLKPFISEAISKNGSYIIISSTDDPSPTALKERIKQMRNSVSGEEGEAGLLLDFYDSNRLATWVRSFESMVIWVRNKVGRPIQGWRPYDNWSYMSCDDEYILDDRLKLKTSKEASDGLCAVDGINKVRAELKQVRSSIRITGLSGVGKTRFVQALFEDSIGEGVLDRTKVIYTDMSFSPSPAPVTMAESLILLNSESILVVDNCLPQLHNQLTQICKRHPSRLSLLTVEYDIRDDLPDETNAFVLEPSSEDLIEKLLERRFEYIQHGIINQIARFSSGNSRLAMALAHTFHKSESIGVLKDEDLFERLFYQGKKKLDNNLQLVAQVCSLVYSFDGEQTSKDSELYVLSQLCSLDVLTIYRNVRELKSRDLIQSRNKWRAVLPHALANRLAKQALDSLPTDFVNSTFLNCKNERFLRSFSRRLGYLHDSESAVSIVNDWLANEGWLGNLIQHDQLQFEIFKNIAPVDQSKTLEVFEYQGAEFLCSKKNGHFEEHFRILKSLAYEENLFVRSCKLLCSMALIDGKTLYGNDLKNEVKKLFQMCLSGTMAGPNVRLEVIDCLIKSGLTKNEDLGMELLSSALDSGHFWGAGSHEFGSRPRSYGYHPKTYGEIKKWYSTFISYIIEFPREDNRISNRLKTIFGEKLVGLLAYSRLYEEIVHIIKRDYIHEFWFDGWLAINRVLDMYNKELTREQKDSFREIRNQISPKTLEDRFEAFVLSSGSGYISCEDLFDLEEGATTTEKSEKLAMQAELCGEEAAKSTKIQDCLERCISNEGRGLFEFGIGLFRGTDSKSVVWTRLKNLASRMSINNTSCRVLDGFLKEGSKHNLPFVLDCLGELLSDESICRFYVSAECTVRTLDRAESRLLKALKIVSIPIDNFRFIGYGRYHQLFSDEELCRIMDGILDRDNGDRVCADILHMRLLGVNNASERIQRIGRKILLALSINSEENGDSRLDYSLSDIVKRCSLDSETIETLVRRERESISGYYLRYENSDYLLSLQEKNPASFLDGFMLDENGRIRKDKITRIIFSNSKNPIQDIEESILLKWIMINPKNRFATIIYLLKGYYIVQPNGPDWINLIYLALKQPYDLQETLEAAEYSTRNHHVVSGGGSEYPFKIKLAQRLINHTNDQVKNWALDFKERMERSYELDQIRQEEFSKRENESFE